VPQDFDLSPDRATLAALTPRLNRGPLALEAGTVPPPHRARVRGLPVEEAPHPLRPAAVLVPLIRHRESFSVLLIERAGHPADPHRGQVSFPGGKVDAADASAEDTALREAMEEVALAREDVHILGHLDPYIVRTGFFVSPVVGVIEGPFQAVPDPREVASAFEMPLQRLLEPEAILHERRTIDGKPRSFFALRHGAYYIWGATAAMLVDLRSRLLAP
jgi:8-oxo-dGTP pyrophosphatase MutT (NUDIX family)